MQWEYHLVPVLLYLALTVSGQLAEEDNEEVKYSRSRRAYESSKVQKWRIYATNVSYYIPFIVQPHEGYDYTTELMEAFEDYNQYTCVQFRPRTHERTYVRMKFVEEIPGNPGTCGLSTVGLLPGGNDRVYFKVGDPECDDRMVYVMRHELFHLVGFYHEHERPDRDDHVVNTRDKSERHARVTDTDITPFDIFSVSHYYHFQEKNRNRPLGNGYGRLSIYDIQGINTAYQCGPPTTLLYGGCYNSDLPRIVGPGRLNTNNSVYQIMEGVRLICDPGYEVAGSQFSHCEAGTFTPQTLTCRKIRCKDKTSKCGELTELGICNVTKYPSKICQQTCGFCERACWTTPLMKGFVVPQKFNKFYLENDTIAIKCQKGYYPITGNIATCIGTEFDIPEFQCVRILEGTKDERRVGETVKKRCEPLDIDVGNGTLVPVKEFYENGDVIQLVCDEGFEPSSTSTAHCRTYGDWTGFHHAKLQCVPKTCEDISSSCANFKRRGYCDRKEAIGAARLYCRGTCGLCGLCKSMPTFDRDISSLSSQKMEYKDGEEVEIKCFKGYHPMKHSTSICMDGVFDPPILQCVPDETSCTSAPNITEAHSIFPRLQLYPAGQVVKVYCGSTQHGHYGYHVGEVTCVDGRFQPFTCPIPSTSCTVDSLESFIETLEECAGEEEYSYSPMDEIFPENSEVEVHCGATELYVYCQNGSFVQPPPEVTYDYEDDFSGSGDYDEGDYVVEPPTITITDHPCFGDSIEIYGGEVITPTKVMYEHGDLITCASRPDVYATCNNGDFDKERLICYQDDCNDVSDNCNASSCSDPHQQENCQFTCGLCERPPCGIHAKHLPYGRTISPSHVLFRFGESGEVICGENSKRIPITCGDRGEFDHDITDPHLCIYDEICRDSFEFCSLYLHDECRRRYIRKYCPGTCKKMCK